MNKVAVVLFNLGGPLDQTAVEPFLFNLFNDRAILGLPHPFRYMLAKFISRKRAPIAAEIYRKIGGGSPILKNTLAQALALEELLNANGSSVSFKTFTAMRYWHPFAQETINDVKAFSPDHIVLLPLYPQFSTTTTGSSLKDWTTRSKKQGLSAPTTVVCCYPFHQGFITALGASIGHAYSKATAWGKPRILFSAHGLPEKIVKAGDPYQAQCEMTVEALRRELGLGDDLDSVLCFQSRVGPLKWIQPATDDEVRRAGTDKVPVVVVPIAFVSDHSETLVELDIEYRELAEKSGVPHYACVEAVGVAPDFIMTLAEMTRAAMVQETRCISSNGTRICPRRFKGCPCPLPSLEQVNDAI